MKKTTMLVALSMILINQSSICRDINEKIRQDFIDQGPHILSVIKYICDQDKKLYDENEQCKQKSPEEIKKQIEIINEEIEYANQAINEGFTAERMWAQGRKAKLEKQKAELEAILLKAESKPISKR